MANATGRKGNGMANAALCLGFGLALAACAPTGALVRAEEQGEPTMMQVVDTNRDGVISHRELAMFWSDRFRGQDTDGNGRITLAEMQALVDASVAHRVQKRFEKLDANGDGVIDRIEFDATRLRWLARVDRNGDGRVTAEELHAPESGNR